MKERTSAHYTRIIILLACCFALITISIRIANSKSPENLKPKGVAQIFEVGFGAHTFRFQPGRDTPNQYLGPANLQRAVEGGQAKPLAMVSDDFNGDGAPDLVIGYSHIEGGALSLRLGNLEAIAPQDPVVLQDIAEGRYPDPFLSQATLYALPEAPDFLQVGDFNADGYIDVLAGARAGSKLYFLEGDGHGAFKKHKEIELPGGLTAMQADDFKQAGRFTETALGLMAPDGPKVLIYNEAGSGLSGEPETYSLNAEVGALAFGQLDDDAISDIAAAAGNEVFIIHGHERSPSKVTAEKAALSSEGASPAPSRIGESLYAPVESASFPFIIKGLAIGDFIFDRAHKKELAVLGEDGTAYISGKGDLDTRPFTQAEKDSIRRQRIAIRRGEQGEESLTTLTEKMVRRSKSNDWNTKEVINTGAAPSLNNSSPTLFKSSRLSGLPTDDLLIGDETGRNVRLVRNTKDARKFQVANISAMEEAQSVVTTDGAPLAVLPMRTSVGVNPGLVVLQQGQAEPIVTIESATTYTVDRTDDSATATACTGAANDCSLRGAIKAANANAGADTILLSANTTYTLTLGPFDDEFNFGGDNQDAGDLDIFDSVSINGGNRDTTIIQMGTLSPSSGSISKDRIIEVNDFLRTQHAYNVTLSNLTLQGGNAPKTPTPDNYITKGGAIMYDGFETNNNTPSGVLTLTNCKVTNNTAAGQGGGVTTIDATLIVQSGSILSGNTSQFGNGGAISYNGGNAVVSQNLQINNSTIGGATAADGNQATDATFGLGGGVQCNGGAGATISNGAIIRNNVAHATSGVNGGGGFIFASLSNIAVSNSTISDNKSNHNAGGIFINANTSASAAGTVTLTTVTMQNNQADSDASGAGDGGAIYNYMGNTTLNNTSGGAISNNSAVNGGGIYTTWNLNSVSPSAGLTVTNGTIITSNSAKNNGGGIDINPGAATTFGTIGLTNVTISNNTANSDNSGGGDGGGIYLTSGPNNSLDGVTVDSNTANSGNGDGITQIGGTLALSNTINVNGGDSIDVNGGTFTSTTGTLNLSGNLSISGGTLNANGGTQNITGNFTLSSGTFNGGTASPINLGGNFSFSGGTFSAGTSTFNFNGSGGQTISGGSVPSFTNLTINDANGVSMSNNVTVGSTLTLTNGALAVNSNTLTLTGAVNRTSGSLTSNANGTVNYAQSSAGQTVLAANYGNLTFSNFAKTLPNGGTVQIRGTFTSPGGGHTVTGSTVEYNGTSAQTMPSAFTTYNNLTLNNAAGVTGFTGLTVNNLLRVQQGTFTSNSATYKDVQIDSGATLAGISTTTVNVTGNFTNNGTLTANTNTFNFNGPAAQSLSGSAATTTFNSLTINNAGGVSLGNSVTVGSTLTLTNGALSVGSTTLTLNGSVTATSGSLTSSASGTVNYNQQSNGQTVLAANYGNLTFSSFNKTLASSGTIGIAGAFTPGNATGHTITGSTINFNGSGGQTIPAFTYNNLTSSSTGARTLDSTGTIKITGTFTPGTNAYTVTGSTVEFNGSSAQTLPTGFTTYNNLTLNNSAGTTGFTGLTAQGLLEVKLGTFTSGGTFNQVQIDSGATFAATSAGTINVLGNWANNGGTFTPSTSTVVFNGSANQSIGGSSAPTQTFNNLTVNKSSGTLSVASNTTTLTLAGTMTLTAGTFDKGTATTINVSGDWANNGGVFAPTAGTVNFNGTGAQNINGSASSQSFFNLTVNKSSQTLSVAVPTVNVSGALTVSAGTLNAGTNNTVNVTGNFSLSGGTFSQSTSALNVSGDLAAALGTTFTKATGGQALTFNGSSAQNWSDATAAGQDFGAVIIGGTNNTVTLQTNIKATSLGVSAGDVFFLNGKGLTLTSPGAVSNNGTVRLTGKATETLSGVTNLDTDSGMVEYVGDGTAGPFVVKDFGAGADYFNLSINDSHGLPGPAVFSLSSGLSVAGSLVLAKGTLSPSANDINVAVDWTNNGGTFIPGTTNAVVFNGTGTQAINGTGTTQAFNNLTVNKSGGILSVGGSTTTLTLNGLMTITVGTLDAGTATTINVFGNWSNSGTFTANNSTLVFNGSNNTQTISGTNSFNNLTINHTGTGGVTASGSTLSVTGLLRIQSGSFTSASIYNSVQIDSGATLAAATPNDTISVTGNWQNNGMFTANDSTIVFNGTSAQIITGSSSNSFNNLTVNNSNGVSLNSPATVSSNLTLVSGVFTNSSTLTINNGDTITRSGGSLSSAPTFVGTVNVAYTGSSPVTTGPEIPTSTSALNNLTINDAAGVALNANATVNGALTLTNGILTTGGNILSLPATATTSRTSGYVNGQLKRTFASTGNFTYMVGTSNAYSPVDVNNTAGTGDLTVTAVQGPRASLDSAKSLQRYWTLTGTGLTLDLTFHYRAADVSGNESNYRVIRIEGSSFVSFPATTIDATDPNDHKATVTGVSNFSDWTAGEPISPTAAPASISGLVTTSDGTPLAGVTIRLGGGLSSLAITDAQGRYSFENVPTDSLYVVTPSRANYSFNPTSRSFSLLADRSDAVFTATPGPETANPLDTPEFFVRQQYLDFFSREPDFGGLNYWTNEITRCGTDRNCINARRRDVAAAFFIESEFQQTGSYIYGLYKASFGQVPSYAAYAGDKAHLIASPNLDANKFALAEEFVNRAEFVGMYPANLSGPQFIDSLLASIKEHSGVDLSAQRANLTKDYEAYGSRARILKELIESGEFAQAEYNKAFVLAEYFSYLRRDSDSGGYDFWVDVLDNHDRNNYHGMVCSFITSAEYQKRFSAVVTRSNSECGQ